MGLALGLGLLFGRRKEDLVFTWFVQTVVFVVFNKVCTSQVRISYAFKRVLLIVLTVLPLVSFIVTNAPSTAVDHTLESHFVCGGVVRHPGFVA